MLMRKFLCLILFCVFASCTYEYMTTHAQRRFKKTRNKEIAKNQAKQLREKHFAWDSIHTATIYIEPIMTRENGAIGIYACNRYATHFGHVTFFEYKNDVVTVLRRTNLDSLQATIELFLVENNFRKAQQEATKRKIKTVWEFDSSDNF